MKNYNKTAYEKFPMKCIEGALQNSNEVHEEHCYTHVYFFLLRSFSIFFD